MALPQPRNTNGGDEVDNRKESGRRNIQGLLSDPKMQPIFSSLLPKHFTPERMVRLSIMAVTRTPKLADCHPMTLLGAFIECAALGLEPNSPLQHVHLLPYFNSRLNQHEVNRIIGYRGFIDLAMRTGKVISLHADVAYQRDTFEVMHGTESVLKHIPSLGAQDRGEPLAAYCHVKLVDGQAFDIVPWFDVLRIKNRSPSVMRGRSSPWDTDLDRMARKTAIRRLFSGGEAPMSVELAQATAIDERQMDYQGLAKANVDEIREALESFAQREAEQETEQGQIGQQRQEERPTEINTGQPRRQSETGAAQASQQDDEKQPYVVGGKSFEQAKRAANAAVALIEATEDEQALEELQPELETLTRRLIEDDRQDQAARINHAFADWGAREEVPGRPVERKPEREDSAEQAGMFDLIQE